jgi:hypothetical protein
VPDTISLRARGSARCGAGELLLLAAGDLNLDRQREELGAGEFAVEARRWRALVVIKSDVATGDPRVPREELCLTAMASVLWTGPLDRILLPAREQR